MVITVLALPALALAAAGDAERVRDAARATQSLKWFARNVIGFLYTTWASKYEDLEIYGKALLARE